MFEAAEHPGVCPALDHAREALALVADDIDLDRAGVGGVQGLRPGSPEQTLKHGRDPDDRRLVERQGLKPRERILRCRCQ